MTLVELQARASSLPPALLERLCAEANRRVDELKLALYKPYAKQREFHLAGLTHAIRLFLAGNQLGKTVAGGAEWAMHLTGRYPNWWEGATFEKAPLLWASGVTGESTRDNPQRILVGPPPMQELWGTGMIPKECLVDWDRAMGVPNLLDNIVVRHGGGGDIQAGRAICAFKAYEKGREKWQGPTVDGVWYDEEPPLDIYAEGLTRTNNGQRGQFAQLTLTPLLGMSEVLEMLLMRKPPGTHVTTMTIEDAEHYTPEERIRIVANYPAHEREARAKGIPILGSGRIFPVEEESIKVAPFEIPSHWPRLAAMDFGSDHPTACSWLTWDRDNDVIYVTDTHRLRQESPIIHAAAVNARGQWIPVSWPHDGNNETAAGPALAKQYRDQGVNMRPENAKYPELNSDGTENKARTSVEAGIADMLVRMQTGKWKAFSHLNDWFEEFRLYHRKDGKIVKERDDLMSSSRYGLMDIRFAETPPQPRERRERSRSWKTA